MPPDDKSEKPQRRGSPGRADLWTVLEIQPHTGEAQQDNYLNERRRYPRYSLERDCTYRVLEQPGFDSATLYDISESGLAIEVKRTMSVGASISILLDDAKSDSFPWLIRATVVRDAARARDGFYRYGCAIKFIVNPDNYFD